MASRPPPPDDSYASLAVVIAKEALGTLGETPHRDDIEREVDRAVRDESCRMERTIAEVRVGLLLLAFVVALASLPGSGDRFRVAGAAGALAVAAAAAAALLVALRRGAYRRWMRQVIPPADALIVAGLFAFLSGGESLAPTMVAAAAGAAVLLAFLGPTRLSRSATRASAVGALGLWAFVALTQRPPWIQVAGVVALIAAASYVGSRMTRGVRRLIAEQVRSLHLGRLYDSAQQALDAREQVLGIVCHDLRTPLTTIGATAGLLLEIPVSEEDRAYHLRVVQRVSGHMDRLIHDLLDVSRIEAGSLAVQPVPCSLQAILESADEVMGPLAADKQIDLRIEAPAEPILVSADMERIQQVLCNLIGNAFKFSPAGTRVSVQARPAGPKVKVSVVDQGPGIPAEDLTELWKRLWQASPGDRRGLGLGLSIAKSIVEAHQESIGVESEPGKGSEFWFTLSLARQAD